MSRISINWGAHMGKLFFTEQGPSDPYITERQFLDVYGEPDLPYKARLTAWMEPPTIDVTFIRIKVAGFGVYEFPLADDIKRMTEIIEDPSFRDPGVKYEPWVWDAVAEVYPKYAQRHNPPEPRSAGRKWSSRSVGTVGHDGPSFWFVKGYLETLRLVSTIQKEAGYDTDPTWKVKLENLPRSPFTTTAVGHWVFEEWGSYLTFNQ